MGWCFFFLSSSIFIGSTGPRDKDLDRIGMNRFDDKIQTRIVWSFFFLYFLGRGEEWSDLSFITSIAFKLSPNHLYFFTHTFKFKLLPSLFVNTCLLSIFEDYLLILDHPDLWGCWGTASFGFKKWVCVCVSELRSFWFHAFFCLFFFYGSERCVSEWDLFLSWNTI